MKLTFFTVLVLTTASTAFAQLDASTLRAKYGAPKVRETFAVRPGIEMVVDYGPNKQVCQMRLPSGRRYVATVPDGAVTKQQIEEVVEEVVPLSTRGKEVNSWSFATGVGESVVEYENVSIREMTLGGIGKGITISFKSQGCPSSSDR